MSKNIIIIFLGVFVLSLAGFRIYQHLQKKNIVDKTGIEITTKDAEKENALQPKEHLAIEAAVHKSTMVEKDIAENNYITQKEKSDNEYGAITTTEADIALRKEILGKYYTIFVKNQNYLPEDVEKFTELLAMLDYISPAEMKKGTEEGMEYVEQLKHERWSNMREFLGENRYQDFLLYYESISERKIVNSLNNELILNNRLDDNTKEKLIIALYEERKKINSPGGVLSAENIDSNEISFADMLTLKAEKYRLCAKEILSKPQMAVFEKLLEASSGTTFEPKIQ